MGMNMKGCMAVIVTVSLVVMSCDRGPAVSTTWGTATVECDESLFPVMRFQAEDFHNSYPDGMINIRAVEAREAVVDFLNDSIRVIIMGRQFNKEELSYIRTANIDYESFKVALDAVVVITNLQRGNATLRITELDSIYNGARTKWNKTNTSLIDAYVGDVNSSTDEVFRTRILNGKPFGATITRIKSSEKLLGEVKRNPNAIGIMGLGWLHGHEQEVTVCRLGGGSYQPDTAVVRGQFFSPAQAHVLRRYYPMSREVFMYTREPRRDVSYGFIAYVKDKKGQQNFVNHGFVPAALPVRMVTTTSEKVHEQ